jgi:outer membrane protein OmpA-like peptidoglycan-associated protein
MSYSWSVNGQQTGQDQSFEFSSTGREPGTYHIGLAVNNDNFNPGSANAAVTVREYRPPTGTVTATPSQIHAGDRSALSSGFQGQCGGPIRAATYEASEGSIQGDQFDSSGVQFDATNNAEQKKTVTITAKASDGRNTGAASTTIEVTKSATIMPVRLPDVLFSDNSSRVNNCGKRVLLEQLRAYYERDAGGTAVLVGHVSSDEKSGTLAQQRASNAAAVITAGQGICLAIPQAQVQVSAPGLEQNGVGFEAGFCSSSVARGSSSATNMRRVEVWFVPSGGKLPASVTNNQSATALSLGGLGCPK